MANLPRKHQKVFAQNSINNGQFGSLEATTKITSNDTDVIQALDAFLVGWLDAVVSGEELPALEEFQGLHYLTTRQISYLLDKGIPEWEVEAEYFIGDIQREVVGTKLYRSEIDNNIGLDINAAAYNAGTSYNIDDVAADVNGDVYRSLTNGNTGNPLSDPVNWELAWRYLGDLANIKDITPNINAIINGNFDIWQRGVSFNTNGAFTADRWKSFTGSGGAFTATQQTFDLGQTNVPNNPKFYLRHDQTTAAVGSGPSIHADIESVLTFEDSTIAISFWANPSTNMSITATVFQDFGTGGSPSAPVGTTSAPINITAGWEKVSVTLNLPSISGKTLGTNGNDKLRLVINLPQNILFTFDLAQVQLEKGDVAKSFKLEVVSETLEKCKRFFERINYGTSGIISMGSIQSTGSIDGKIEYSEKRDLPSVSSSFFTINGWKFRSSNVDNPLLVAPVFGSIQKKECKLIVTGFIHGAGANGDSGIFIADTLTNGTIDINAEL
jgi:hypothetical protein